MVKITESRGGGAVKIPRAVPGISDRLI